MEDDACRFEHCHVMSLFLALAEVEHGNLRELFPFDETTRKIREGGALEDFVEKAEVFHWVCSPDKRAVRDEIEGLWRFILDVWKEPEFVGVRHNGLTLMVELTHEIMRIFVPDPDGGFVNWEDYIGAEEPEPAEAR